MQTSASYLIDSWFEIKENRFSPFDKVDTLEFEKILASWSHHSGSMVQPIMLDNLQEKYTPDSSPDTQLHLVW